MTISAQTASDNRTSAAGNGVTTSFSFPKPFTAQADLVVLLVLVASPFTQTLQTLNTDYTISGTADAQGRYGAGANVVFSVAPSALYNVVIYADPSVAQGLDLVENDPLPAEQVELMGDKAVLLVRRIKDQLARCFRLVDSSVSTGTTTVEPVASQFLGFDASKNLVCLAASSGLTTVSSYFGTLLTAVSAAALRILMGFNGEVLWCGTATGTANALVLTPTPAAATLAAGARFVFKSSASPNSAATTVAISGQVAVAAQSNGAAMVGGEIEASKWYEAVYDGAALQVTRLAPSILLSLFTTKGDLAVATAAGAVARLAAGANGLPLVTDSTQTTGLKWGFSTQTANTVYGGPTSGTAAAPTFRALVPADLSMTPIANVIGSDVATGATGTYTDGPSVAQGTTGTWLVEGTVTVTDGVGAATVRGKLYDGSTTIASAEVRVFGASAAETIPLSGVITNPAGNLRIAVADFSSGSGKILFNQSGLSKDSNITAVRIG